jgi:IclR family transcriptional regulator, acetate operon repressor
MAFSHNMRYGTPLLSATHRALLMLEAVIADGGTSNVSAIARKADLPIATAHRQVKTLAANGYLTFTAAGRYIAGPRLRTLLKHVNDEQIISNIAAPLLNRLAAKVGAVVQLGTLDNDMVTYRIKIGEGAGDLFTMVGMQLEAYCSGIGKVLLAYLPEQDRAAYLAGGPFIALTPHTIVEPQMLALELKKVAKQGYAADEGEIAEGLYCMAVPIHRLDGGVPAAISISRTRPIQDIRDRDALIAILQETATEIERAITAVGGWRTFVY